MGEESLAHMIKRRRETLGFSQARLGELVGRSASTIRNWERGKSTPSAAADARALAAVLGLSEGKVVEAAGFEPAPTESHQTVEQAYATLAPQRPSVEEVDEQAEDPETEPATTDAPPPPEEAPAIAPGSSQPDDQVEPEPEAASPEREASVDDARVDEASGDEASEDGQTLAAEEEEPVAEAKEEPVAEENKEEPGKADEEARFETPLPPRRPDRARAPEGRRLRPVAVEADDEPAVARAAPPTVLETAPPAEPSYLEDPEERQRYRVRAVATAAVVILLLIVFFWSFDQTVEALGSMWDEFAGMLEL